MDFDTHNTRAGRFSLNPFVLCRHRIDLLHILLIKIVYVKEISAIACAFSMPFVDALSPRIRKHFCVNNKCVSILMWALLACGRGGMKIAWRKMFRFKPARWEVSKIKIFLEALAPIDMIIFELRKIKCKCGSGTWLHVSGEGRTEPFSRLFNKKCEITSYLFNEYILQGCEGGFLEKQITLSI